MTETFDPHVGTGRFFFFGGVLFLIGWIAFAVFSVASIPQQIASLPVNVRSLAILAVFGLVLVTLKFPALYLWVGFLLRSCDARSVTVTADHIEARLTDGRTERHAWRDLQRNTTRAAIRILTFRNGLELRMHTPRRTAAVAKLMQTSLGLPVRDNRPLSLAQFIRICVWSLLGGGAAAALISYINAQGLGAGRSPLAAFLGTTLMYPPVILISAFAEPWLKRRLEHWGSRKRRPRHSVPDA